MACMQCWACWSMMMMTQKTCKSLRTWWVWHAVVSWSTLAKGLVPVSVTLSFCCFSMALAYAAH